MKHLRKCKFLALLLVFCMCFTAVAPMSAEAAKGKAASQSTETKSKKNNKKNENNESSSSSSDVSSAVELVLEEDETTVVNGDMLRASTYGIATAAETGTAVAAAAETDNIKYYSVTMFNYDAAKFNARLSEKTNRLRFTGGGNGENPAYNTWTGHGSNTNGNDVYCGLVQPELDSNKNIQFTVPEAGIFTGEEFEGKEIYTNVDLPFEYDSSAEKYTFDANTMGAYFANGAADNIKLTYSTEPQKNAANEDATQDKRVNGWYPFNSTLTVTPQNADYHFGMVATIPFTMTVDGKLSSSANAQDIIFNFSGDDDVWVFIDGQLVLDLGGIHNGVNGSLNFADNTFNITRMVPTVGKETADASGNGAPMSGKIFNDANGKGKINQTRESFAAADNHELTVYYLERGKGSSNCKIEFNLPMKDSVSVTKRVNTKDSENQALAADVLEQINNRSFGFTLYKDNDPVANSTYSLLNENGQFVQIASTNSDGHFTLKNNQTAKFIGEIAATGNGYYVVEDAPGEGWENPAFTCTASAANGATETASTTDGQSMTVTAKGSEEAEDSVLFVCTNTMTHVNGITLEANDDKIVIDYGLPVEIDVLANDVAVAGTKSIEEVTGAQFGTTEIVDGKIKYTLTRQLTDVEILTYTAKATATNGVASDNKTATAKVYIVPATTMYYEENFSDMVKVTAGPATSVGNSYTACQEPGVVGTVGDSPYGSDKVYLENLDDSYGTSMYFDLTNGAKQFSYTFTGAGTSFFARTTNESAYMRVAIKDVATNKVVYTGLRDTRYLNNNKDILYNIPVFTYYFADNPYGTYTVTVTLAKGGEGTNYGGDFWLDGIRVYNPLDTNENSRVSIENLKIANDAYLMDGEAYCTIATLREKMIAEDMTVNEEDELVWSMDDVADGNFVLFTDSNGKIVKASEYVSKGPKEEIYLFDGQSVRFKIKNWDPNTNHVYLGMKAPMGTGSDTVILNSRSKTIKNTVDCYYEITDATVKDEANGTKTAFIEIAAGSNCLISLTTIKLTGNAKLEAITPDDIMAN